MYDSIYYYKKITEEEYQKKVVEARKKANCNTVRHVLSIYSNAGETLKLDRSRFNISLKDDKGYLVNKNIVLSNYDLKIKYFLETTIVNGFEVNDLIYQKIGGIGCFIMQRDNYMKSDGSFFHASESYGNSNWHDDARVIKEMFKAYESNWQQTARIINEKDFIEGKMRF